MSMYRKVVLLTLILAFVAVVFSAYARLSDAGLGCDNWPVCYEENALKQRHPTPADIANEHSSWKWQFQNFVGLILGLLAIAICALAWLQRKELRQSPLLPTVLVGLMGFLAVFGIWAFSHLSRPAIVSVHLAGGVAMLMLLVWIMLEQEAPVSPVGAAESQKWRGLSWLGIALVLVQIMLGGWVSSNFAALACTDFPLCQGALLPTMDFSSGLDSDLLLSPEQLTAIQWTHRVGALVMAVYLGWLSFRIMAVESLRKFGKVILGLVVLQLVLGASHVLLGLSLVIAILHNAVAMSLLVVLMALSFWLQKRGV